MTDWAKGQWRGRCKAPSAGSRAALTVMLLCLAGPVGADTLRQAAEALEEEDFVTAIPYLEEALEEAPGNVNARFNLAYALQSTGDSEGAIRHYRTIAEQQPDLLPVRQNLATLLMQSGQFEAAAQEYEALVHHAPQDLRLLELLAIARREAGDHPAAAEAFRQLLTIHPESLDTIVGLAQSLEASGQLHEAVPHYLRAAAMDPRHLETLAGLARRLEEQGHRQDAIELYRRYARDRPRNAAAQEEIGILLLEDGKLRAASDALERAVMLEPTFQRHAALAEVYRRSGDVSAAHEQLRLAAGVAPDNALARVRYASSLLQRQEFEDAAREYLAAAKAAEADGTAADAWKGLAFATFQLGDFATTVRAIEQSERLQALSAPTIYLKALALDKLQQYEPAQAAYRAFLANRPEMPDEVWKAEQRLKAIERVLRKR